MNTKPTPITFFGSDQYSTTVLERLLTSPQIKVNHLVTTPHISTHPLHQLATIHHIPITLYSDFLTQPSRTVLEDQIGVLASFGHILPPQILNLFPQGILCLHPSLLPQYRNASPVPYAIALGDKTTGVTLFQIDQTIDNGKIISQKSAAIQPTDTSPTLLHRLFTLGAQLTISHLTQPSRTVLEGIKLDHPLIFTKKLTSQSGYLEWQVIQKLIHKQPINIQDTQNELLRLRLSRSPLKTNSQQLTTILPDLIRALEAWQKVWTIAPTKKGNLRVSFPYHPNLNTELKLLIAGKPKPISWQDFSTYYL